MRTNTGAAAAVAPVFAHRLVHGTVRVPTGELNVVLESVVRAGAPCALPSPWAGIVSEKHIPNRIRRLAKRVAHPEVRPLLPWAWLLHELRVGEISARDQHAVCGREHATHVAWGRPLNGELLHEFSRGDFHLRKALIATPPPHVEIAEQAARSRRLQREVPGGV